MTDSLMHDLGRRLRAAATRLAQLRRRAAERVDRPGVMQHVRDGGDLAPRFMLLTVLSCGIAVLGLLQNSVAVIIGAMLVSPLMGPIVALGFSLTTVDFAQMKHSVLALAVGVLLALTISVLIVSVSPLQTETPEILARTQPNLFDLLVAVLSGLAGGYAVITRKGEAIVGVAIATALMPPLAVVGYGLATLKWHIAAGSFFLFMTNLLAIALSVAVLARWYRFTTSDSPSLLLWQSALTFGVFVALSVPLGFALVDIARKTVISVTVRDEVEREFAKSRASIERLEVTGGDSRPLAVLATVLTPRFNDQAGPRVASRLAERLGGTPTVEIEQIVVSREDMRERIARQAAETALLRNRLEPVVAEYNERKAVVEAVQATVYFATRTLDVEPTARRIRVEPRADVGMEIPALRRVEQSLQQRFPGWEVVVTPPVAALPSIYFETGSDSLIIGQAATVDDAIWALRAWQVERATVVGFASSSGSLAANAALAEQRAERVAMALRAAGLDAVAIAEARVPNQRELERRYGLTYLQRVDVRIGQQPASLPPQAGAD
jgi:uncharacterized hydrophobic protein (TIGR00271 family)